MLTAAQCNIMASCRAILLGTDASRSIEHKSGASNLASNPARKRLDYIMYAVAADVSVNHPDRVDGYE